MLSENEQKQIVTLSGRLASLFEDLYNLHSDSANEDKALDLAANLLDMFSKQDSNLNVDLFKNIFNRLHGK